MTIAKTAQIKVYNEMLTATEIRSFESGMINTEFTLNGEVQFTMSGGLESNGQDQFDYTNQEQPEVSEEQPETSIENQALLSAAIAKVDSDTEFTIVSYFDDGNINKTIKATPAPMNCWNVESLIENQWVNQVWIDSQWTTIKEGVRSHELLAWLLTNKLVKNDVD